MNPEGPTRTQEGLEGFKRTKKDPVRPSKQRQYGQAAFVDSRVKC